MVRRNGLRLFALHAAWFLLLVSWLQAGWLCDGIEICTQPNNQGSVRIVPDATGGAIIVWTDYRSGGYDIYAQRVDSEANVLWDEDGTGVCTASGPQGVTEVTPDGAGGAIIAWTDYRFGRLDLFAQRLDGSGASLWAPNGIPICTEFGDQWQHDITSDGAGGAIIAWEDRRRDFDSADVYAQRVDADGNMLWAIDGVFVATATVYCTTKISPDGTGGAIITWMDERSGDTDIYAQRIGPDGIVLWTVDGVPVCDAVNHQDYQCMVSDGDGGAFVAWEDYRSDTLDIYAQRVSPTGASLWAPGGVVVCGATGRQSDPKIISDGTGGAIVIWADRRTLSPTFNDIYAQRVDAYGNMLWDTDGVVVSGATGYQSYPDMISNGAGGGIIAWRDSRHDNYDIYAQQIDSSGTAIWTADGIALCTAEGTQMAPRLALSQTGVAIVTWVDGRDGHYDIYAQYTQDWSGFSQPRAVITRHVRACPNPFSTLATVTLHLEEPSELSIKIFDTSGRLVRTLVQQHREAGAHSVKWDGKDDGGRLVASGVYLCRVNTRGSTETTKIVFAK